MLTLLESMCKFAEPALHLMLYSQVGSSMLPVGLQLVGRSMGEAALLELGHVVEQTLALKAPALPVLSQQPALARG